MAIRRCLPDVVDTVRVLEVISQWLGQWAGREVPLLPGQGAVKKNEKGVLVVDVQKGKASRDLPSVNEVCILFFHDRSLTLTTIPDYDVPAGHYGLVVVEFAAAPACTQGPAPHQLSSGCGDWVCGPSATVAGSAGAVR